MMASKTQSRRLAAEVNVRCDSVYLSPRDLVLRWRCSRSTVDRITRREGLTRLQLGEGRHGIVRFLREEVEALEASRLLDADD